MARNLVAASPVFDRAEVKWFREIEGLTFEELGRPQQPRFQALEAQMAASLCKILPEQLRTRVQVKEQDAFKRDATLNGRQIVWMIYDWFRTDANISTFYSLADLSRIEWLGDKPADMQRFLQTWDRG